MSPPAKRRKPTYDRRLAEHYWAVERRRLGDAFRIVLSAGESHAANAAYHLWESETLRRALPRRRSLVVLDIACGLGRISAVLADRRVRIVGLDNALDMLRAARRAVARRNARSGIGWTQGVSHELPFADASFDAVTCLGLLEHLPAPLQRATLSEAVRVLRPGGSLLFVLNNDRSLLLRDGADNRHRQARQLENGYFCGLVKRRELVETLGRHGVRVETLGSNAHYSLLRHALHRRALGSGRERSLVEAFRSAAERDLAEPEQGFLGQGCADHFFYRGRKTSRRGGARRG